MGYNSVAIFIRLAAVASQICEIPRNSTKIRTYIAAVQGHPRSWILVSIERRICNFLLVINSNYEWIICNRFRDIDAFSSKIAWFSTNDFPLVRRPPGGESLAIST